MQHHRDEDLHRALIQAADGCLEKVQELIVAGADVNGMPLIMAIQTNSGAILEELIKAGVDLNRPFGDTTPLVRAIEVRYPDIVALLVRAGANVNLRAPNGITPLQAALSLGRANATLSEKLEIIHILQTSGTE